MTSEYFPHMWRWKPSQIQQTLIPLSYLLILTLLFISNKRRTTYWWGRWHLIAVLQQSVSLAFYPYLLIVIFGVKEDPLNRSKRVLECFSLKIVIYLFCFEDSSLCNCWRIDRPTRELRGRNRIQMFIYKRIQHGFYH